jgi:hypothetical protein
MRIRRAAPAGLQAIHQGGRRRQPPPGRRTSQDIAEIKAAMYEWLEREHPRTVRAVFYAMEVRGFVHKTEGECKETVGRLLTIMRRDGTLPCDWIEDPDRAEKSPWTHDSLQDFVRFSVAAYRRALWSNQPERVEIWLEKNALASRLYEVTEEYDVPLMVCGGFTSLSFLHEAATKIAHVGKPTHLYYFGDHDPSGKDIDRVVEKDLRHFAPHADITFTRMAVTRAQIAKYNLPTRPTKKSDARAKNFKGESTEIDAMSVDVLQQLVRDCIEPHIHHGLLAQTRRAEANDKKKLRELFDVRPKKKRR